MAETLSPPSDRPTCTRTRRASVAAPDTWKAFKHKGAPRGTPKASSLSRLRYRSKIPVRNRRTSSEQAENAAKEHESLSEYMPNTEIFPSTCTSSVYYKRKASVLDSMSEGLACTPLVNQAPW